MVYLATMVLPSALLFSFYIASGMDLKWQQDHTQPVGGSKGNCRDGQLHFKTKPW